MNLIISEALTMSIKGSMNFLDPFHVATKTTNQFYENNCLQYHIHPIFVLLLCKVKYLISLDEETAFLFSSTFSILSLKNVKDQYQINIDIFSIFHIKI